MKEKYLFLKNIPADFSLIMPNKIDYYSEDKFIYYAQDKKQRFWIDEKQWCHISIRRLTAYYKKTYDKKDYKHKKEIINKYIWRKNLNYSWQDKQNWFYEKIKLTPECIFSILVAFDSKMISDYIENFSQGKDIIDTYMVLAYILEQKDTNKDKKLTGYFTEYFSKTTNLLSVSRNETVGINVNEIRKFVVKSDVKRKIIASALISMKSISEENE